MNEAVLTTGDLDRSKTVDEITSLKSQPYSATNELKATKERNNMIDKLILI